MRIIRVSKWLAAVFCVTLPLMTDDARAVSAAAPKKLAELRVKKLSLKPGGIAVSMRWSADGKSLFVLSTNGDLRRLGVPDLKELQSTSLGGAANRLERSKEGLVAVLSITQEICLIDEQSLNINRRIKFPGMRALACSPLLSVAYVTGKRSLSILDLKKGRVRAVIDSRTVNRLRLGVKRPTRQPPQLGIGFPSVTPDGKYLMTQGDGRLNRFRIKGFRLKWEEQGHHIAYYPKRLCVSSDSKSVVLTASSNLDAPGHPKMKSGLYVYDVGNLQKPRTGIEAGGCTWIAADPVNKRIYAAATGGQFKVFAADGKMLREYRFPGRSPRDTPLQVLVHPSGGKLLALCGQGVFWVEIP